jgi:simple sugar transport system ATP-binding protein
MRQPETEIKAPPLLALRGVTKTFPGVVANDRIDLEIRAGEVHALLGENGAGKSTLMKILYGFYRADSGEIRHNGRLIPIRSPQDARRYGIGMVFQEFVQIPAMTVAENIALFLPNLTAVLNQTRINKRIEELSRRYGLAVDPLAPVWQLSVGERQKLETLKLLLTDARILIFDEPTRNLALHEVENLFKVFANLRRDGYAVVFIAHKLREVLACADRITVLRRGRVAGTRTREGTTESDLVALMFGAAVEEVRPRRAAARPKPTPPVLELRRVGTRAQGHARGLDEINLTVGRGEIVGVAGVSGNGQKELGDVILGLEKCSRGSKHLWGEDATSWSVARIRADGAAFIPEDPLAMAAVASLTVLENMVLGNTGRYARYGGLSMDWGAAREDFERSMNRLGFAVPALGQKAGSLSGGNVQRMVFAREMARNPRLIVALYPTRGLDVRSAAAARELLVAGRSSGCGVLLISDDLAELFALSDRLAVLFRSRIVAVGDPQEMTFKQVGYLMTGSSGDHERNE